MYLLIKAQHSDYKGLKEGQLRTSIPQIQDACSHYIGYRKVRPSKDKIYQILNWLRSGCEASNEADTKATMITTTKATQGLLVTICNYKHYQDLDNYGSNDEPDNEKSAKPKREQHSPDNTNKYEKNDKNEHSKKKVKKENKFTPPTFEEVKAYAEERGGKVNPQEFWDFFTADPDRQWIDSKGTPVKSWKQKMVTWEKFNGRSQKSNTSTNAKGSESRFDNIHYDIDGTKS